ncbi:type II toxin-antitoxin system Phd/YefM family antitoxin [Mycobacterium avium]|uniref:type II toxin-antitoxin system Phd/YefM family antitoxin n=1 Tax=Mycobacterium avium TaxID=1764 RepID=UPI00115585D1|nr:type II toxin-antitoxin system prevent-host-death family antitoxin [Mycobacterium avium]
MSEPVGIRQLRQNASEIISAAEAGQAFHVTVRGKDTGVVIAKHISTPPAQRRRGVTLTQIRQAQVYRQPAPTGYEEAMLELLERGRDDAGRVGESAQ